MGHQKAKEQFHACNMLAKNRINRNKTDNRAKIDIKKLDFMPFIQNNINGHVEWEQNIFLQKWLIFKDYSLLK